MEPLGTLIATNASWGGLQNLEKSRRPIPKDTVELTERTIAVAQRTLGYHGLSLNSIPGDLNALKADDEIRKLWQRNPWRLEHRTKVVNLGVEYPKSAAIAPGQTKQIITHLENPHPATLELHVELQGAGALSVANPSRLVVLGPNSEASIPWDVSASSPLDPCVRLNLALAAKKRPALPSIPIVLLGTSRWRLLAPLLAEGRSDRELFDVAFPPEILTGPLTCPSARAGSWYEADSEDNAIPFKEPFAQAGVLYAQTFTWSPRAQAVRIGAPCNTPVKIWLNGKLCHEAFVYRPLRPNYTGYIDGQALYYADLELQSGWNEILLKFVRGDEPLLPSAATFAAECTLADPNDLFAGLTDQVRSRFPWE